MICALGLIFVLASSYPQRITSATPLSSDPSVLIFDPSNNLSARPRIPEWVHCTAATSWQGNPPMTLDGIGEDCEKALEWMREVDIDPNWGLGNLFEFLAVGVQPVMGLPLMRVPRRYTFGKLRTQVPSRRIIANQDRGHRQNDVL